MIRIANRTETGRSDTQVEIGENTKINSTVNESCRQKIDIQVGERKRGRDIPTNKMPML